MKSKVKLLGTLAISAISFLSYVQISHSEKLDDLLLENIEALAAGESGDDSKCFGSGSIVCPLTNQGVAHVQIYYSLITLHPNAERITEQSGVQWLHPRFQLDCLRKIHVSDRSCYFFLCTRGKGQCG